MTSFPSIPVSSPAPHSGSHARRRAVVGLGAGPSLQAANATSAADPTAVWFANARETNWSTGAGTFRGDNTVQTGSDLSTWAATFTGTGASNTAGPVVVTDRQNLTARRFPRLVVTR